MIHEVKHDAHGWYVNDGIRRYPTQDDARVIAAALRAGFIKGETDKEVKAALSVMARVGGINGVRAVGQTPVKG